MAQNADRSSFHGALYALHEKRLNHHLASVDAHVSLMVADRVVANSDETYAEWVRQLIDEGSFGFGFSVNECTSQGPLTICYVDTWYGESTLDHHKHLKNDIFTSRFVFENGKIIQATLNLPGTPRRVFRHSALD